MKNDDLDLRYREFQELYFKEYGVKISELEARNMGDRLLALYKAVFKGSCKRVDK